MSADAPDVPARRAQRSSAYGARGYGHDLQQKGLHARAAARFVKTAAQFEAEITVRKNGTAVSGRSIMGLMMLAAGLRHRASRSPPPAPTPSAAVEALARLIECKFDED